MCLPMRKAPLSGKRSSRPIERKNCGCPVAQVLRFQRQAALGTIFSHRAKGNCASAGESPEHIYIKTLIAKAAIDAGWRAITEFRGTSPSGSQWIADVYCTKDDEARVIEVQLSGQSPEEFNRRQRMYIESSVKSLWLASRFNRNRLIPSLELPVFELEMIGDMSAPMVKEFELPLPEFVSFVLSGRLRWKKSELLCYTRKMNAGVAG